MKPEKYDFSCCVISYGRKSSNNRIYKNNCLKDNDGVIVPLIWNHHHNDLESILGTASLENRDEGIYAYCTLYNIPIKEIVVQMIQDRGSVSLSPFITHVEYDTKYITHGMIKEVSLVSARIDQDEIYYPVMGQELEGDAK